MPKLKYRISYGYFVSNVFIETLLKIVIALGHILADTIVKMQVRVIVTKYWVITVIQHKRQKQFIRQVRQWHFVMIWSILHTTNKVKLVLYMITKKQAWIALFTKPFANIFFNVLGVFGWQYNTFHVIHKLTWFTFLLKLAKGARVNITPTRNRKNTRNMGNRGRDKKGKLITEKLICCDPFV